MYDHLLQREGIVGGRSVRPSSSERRDCRGKKCTTIFFREKGLSGEEVYDHLLQREGIVGGRSVRPSSSERRDCRGKKCTTIFFREKGLSGEEVYDHLLPSPSFESNFYVKSMCDDYTAQQKRDKAINNIIIIIIMAGMAVVLRGWLPHRGEAQMAYNYCFPTRTMF